MLANLARRLSCDIDEANLAVRAEQIRARLRSYPLMIAGQGVVALLLVGLLWGKVAHHVLLAWIVTLFSANFIEAFTVWRYRAATRNAAECRLWRTRFIGFVCVIGLIWGVGGVLLFVPDDLAYQAMLICVVLGVAAGAVTTNPVYPASLYIFVVLLIGPVMTANLWIGDQPHLILAGMLAVYMAYVLNAGRALSRTFESSLRMDFENAQLVGLLVEENQRAEAAQRQAEQASRTKSKFLAAASHDLRQPMHALALFVEVLKNRTHDAQSTQLIAQVEDSVGVLDKMFEALLDISKLDAGVVHPQLESFAIQPLLDRMYAEFSWLAQEKSLRLEVTCDSIAVVRSDPLLLERILRNLIANAIRYTVQGQVDIACTQVAEGLRVEVCDTGIGIAPEHLPDIFEAYYQVGNQQRDRSKGLGLGLAIVKHLEKLLGYQMQVSSTPGVGTSFVLLIPERKSDDMIELG